MAGGGFGKKDGLFFRDAQELVVLRRSPVVRKKDLRGHGLDDGLADAGVAQLAGVLRHHDDDAVHLAQRDEPVLEPCPEIGIVEQLPGLIEHDDGGAAVFDHALDLAEDVGKHRHALGGHVEDLGHVEADDVAVEREGRFGSRGGEDPTVAPARCPFRDP